MADPKELAALERQIAEEHCRMFIETRAKLASLAADTVPLYDVSQLESSAFKDYELLAADMAEIIMAVRYLDLREMLERPVEGRPELVRFKGRQGEEHGSL